MFCLDQRININDSPGVSQGASRSVGEHRSIDKQIKVTDCRYRTDKRVGEVGESDPPNPLESAFRPPTVSTQITQEADHYGLSSW